MIGGDDFSVPALHDFTPLFRHPERRSQQGLSGRCTEANDHARPDQLELGHKPRPARCDLA